MKKLVKIFSREVVALYIATQIAQGIQFENYLEGIFIAGIALAAAQYVVKPIVNMLLLPINLATLGLFRFLSHAITLFIVDVALNQFVVTSFHITGFTSKFFDMPTIDLPGGPLAYVGFSVILFVITSLL